MKEPRKDNLNAWTNDQSIAARCAPIHDMVTDLLARRDPGGFVKVLECLRAEYKPEGVEERVVEFMADLSWRIRGCFALETEILSQSMEPCAGAQGAPRAPARAHMRDAKGANLLDKLSTYESRLSREFSRCLRLLQLRAKNRKYAEARLAATLAKRKPCTSVIQ